MPETRTKGAKTNSKARANRSEEAAGPVAAPACTVAFCPICMAVTAAQGAAPDALEHLLNAAREMFLFARAVIDVRADDLDGKERPGPRNLERIEIA